MCPWPSHCVSRRNETELALFLFWISAIAVWINGSKARATTSLCLVLSIDTLDTFLHEEGHDIMFLSRFFGLAATEPPTPNQTTIPAHGTVHNKDYSNIFSNIDSDSDSDSVDGSSVVPYVRPYQTTSSRSRSPRQLTVKSAAFRAKLQRKSAIRELRAVNDIAFLRSEQERSQVPLSHVSSSRVFGS